MFRGLYANCLSSAGENVGYIARQMIIAETERLILRHFHIVDGEAMDRIFCDPEVMYFGYGVQSPEWARKWLRHYSFGTLGMSRLISIIDARNHASIRVAEKVGMRFEKDVIFQGFPDRVYAMERPSAHPV
jgi:RimJ/RimL family protein N-acetyltransferase